MSVSRRTATPGLRGSDFTASISQVCLTRIQTARDQGARPLHLNETGILGRPSRVSTQSSSFHHFPSFSCHVWRGRCRSIHWIRRYLLISDQSTMQVIAAARRLPATKHLIMRKLYMYVVYVSNLALRHGLRMKILRMLCICNSSWCLSRFSFILLLEFD